VDVRRVGLATWPMAESKIRATIYNIYGSTGDEGKEAH